MKKLTILAAALTLATSSYALSIGDTFNVGVTFTSSCSVSTAAADIAMTYTAFAAAASTGSASTTFTCSRGLSPTFQFDVGGAGVQTASAAASTGNITAEGLIAGLRYTLTAAVPTVSAGTAAAAGAAGTGGTNGTADTYSLTINANIPAGQAGDGNAATAISQTRTLTIVY